MLIKKGSDFLFFQNLFSLVQKNTPPKIQCNKRHVVLIKNQNSQGTYGRPLPEQPRNRLGSSLALATRRTSKPSWSSHQNDDFDCAYHIPNGGMLSKFKLALVVKRSWLNLCFALSFSLFCLLSGSSHIYSQVSLACASVHCLLFHQPLQRCTHSCYF